MLLRFIVGESDMRAIVIEGGMQNSGLGMVIIASLWGIWHIDSGMTLATLWRRKDARLGL